MKTKSLNLFSFLFLLLSGCALEMGNHVSEPQTYSLDGVKWISPTITNGGDPTTYVQPIYTISDSGRLLMRFESLGEKVNDISLGDGRKVEVWITLNSGENVTAAESTLRLCPVMKNWMMYATWRSAYPMGTSGAWSKDGADFDEAACITGSATSTTLHFDVTNWIVNTVRGRGQNFGLVLISGNGGAVQIRGDSDSAYSPRITWIQAR